MPGLEGCCLLWEGPMWRLSNRKAVRAIMKPEGSVQEPGALGKGRSQGSGRAVSGRALWAT